MITQLVLVEIMCIVTKYIYVASGIMICTIITYAVLNMYRAHTYKTTNNKTIRNTPRKTQKLLARKI